VSADYAGFAAAKPAQTGPGFPSASWNRRWFTVNRLFHLASSKQTEAPKIVKEKPKFR